MGLSVSVTGTSRLMVVIGDPVTQVRTPAVINPIYAARGANIVCLPLHIRAELLADAWAGLKAMQNVIGIGVTLPHKEAVLDLCDSLDPLAATVGACNVVRREADGSLRGYQFDGPGFVTGLTNNGVTLAGRDCLMLGAGGAATGIAFALLRAGVSSLTIANRTAVKADALASKVNAHFGSVRAASGAPVPHPGQLIVNATSLGLSPSDPLPMSPEALAPGMTVAEVIAAPEFTPLLQAARERGAEVHSGMAMIRGQATAIADHLCEIWHPDQA